MPHRSNDRKLSAKVVSIGKGQATMADANGTTRAVPLETLTEGQQKTALIDVIGTGVVVIHTKDIFNEPSSVGSGFVFRKDGLILTNYHVICGAASIEVRFRGNNLGVMAECLAVDREHDVAVLRVNRLPQGTHVLELAPRSLPKPGDKVWTIGHPNQLVNTISWGNVSAVRRTAELPEEVRAALQLDERAVWIQTDAVIDHGSSGGPLLNGHGQVIGMNTFMVGAQLGFALHVSHGRSAFEQARSSQPMQLPFAPGKGESALAWASREVGPPVRAFTEEIQKLQMIGLPEQQFIKRAALIQARYRKQLLKIVRDNPSGWPAFQASHFVCSMMLDQSQDSLQCQQEVCDLLLKHHVDKEELGAIMLALIPLANDAARSFCIAVEDRAPHREVRALAAVAVAEIRLLSLAHNPSADLREVLAARAEVNAIATRFETEYRDLDGRELAQVLREKLATLPIGQPAAEIDGKDADGKSFKLSDYRGKVVVLNFFADWCPYSKRMYSIERQLVEEYAERPFALLGVNTDEQQVLRELVQQGTVTWRCWADGSSGPIAASWDVAMLPCIYLIDHRGIVRRQISGLTDERVLSEAIEALVREAEQGAAAHTVATVVSN